MQNKFKPEELVEEIIKRLAEGESDDLKHAPGLTQDLYEIDVPEIKDMVSRDEFHLVCNAIDMLLAEGKITFDPATGELNLQDKALSSGQETTSPDSHNLD